MMIDRIVPRHSAAAVHQPGMFLRSATRRELLSLTNAMGLTPPLDVSPIKKKDAMEEAMHRKMYHREVCRHCIMTAEL